MASFAETGPRSPVIESIRVDQVTPAAKIGLLLRMIVAIVIAAVMLIPVLWMTMTGILPPR